MSEYDDFTKTEEFLADLMKGTVAYVSKVMALEIDEWVKLADLDTTQADEGEGT